MKTSGVSNINNKHYSDKFELIERNNNNSSPSLDLLSYSNISNNNVYVEVDLDSHHSLMPHSNGGAHHQWAGTRAHERSLSNSTNRKPFDEQSFYNSTASRSVHSSYGKI
jgi:hypothetical protein